MAVKVLRVDECTENDLLFSVLANPPHLISMHSFVLVLHPRIAIMCLYTAGSCRLQDSIFLVGRSSCISYSRSLQDPHSCKLDQEYCSGTLQLVGHIIFVSR